MRGEERRDGGGAPGGRKRRDSEGKGRAGRKERMMYVSPARIGGVLA